MISKPIPIGSATAALVLALLAQPASAHAADASRCGNAIATASYRILRTDSRTLTRCALAILQQHSASEIEERCGQLRTPGLRVDRLDVRSRGRIARRCSAELPAWMPMRCPGPGPFAGSDQRDGEAVAECVVMSAHCAALNSLDSVFTDAIGTINAQRPENLAYPFNGDPRNTFLACGEEVPTTTTTMEVPSSTSTSTTLPPTGEARVIITEIMANPAALPDSEGEYFEIVNDGTAAVDLAGLEISDLGSDSFTVDESFIVAPGEHAVFGKSELAALGTGDFVYGSAMSLTNSADAIILSLNGTVLDQVSYDSEFPATAGRAMVLKDLSSESNDSAQAWCLSNTPMGDGDFGSPGSGDNTCLP